MIFKLWPDSILDFYNARKLVGLSRLIISLQVYLLIYVLVYSIEMIWNDFYKISIFLGCPTKYRGDQVS